MALATVHRVDGDNKSGDTRAVRGCCKFKGVLRGGMCRWEGLAPSGRQLYPGTVCLTHCWFQKGPSIFPSRVLFYVLSGLAGLPLRVAIAIFIYTQLRNGSGCPEGDVFNFLLESLQQGFSVSGRAHPSECSLPRGPLRVSKRRQL